MIKEGWRQQITGGGLGQENFPDNIYKIVEIRMVGDDCGAGGH